MADKAACVGHPAFAKLHGKPGTDSVEQHPDFFQRPEDRPAADTQAPEASPQDHAAAKEPDASKPSGSPTHSSY